MQSDPVDDYRRAVDRLSDLTADVAAQRSQSVVLDVIVDLRLSVVRAYGGRRRRHPQGKGARGLILDYLVLHLGEWVYGEELAAVSDIGEWARRVRELRVEEGYEIDENAGRYRLNVRDPNLGRRDRWQTVTAVRGEPGTAVDRVRQLFVSLPQEVITVEELDRVAHGRDGVRLAREIRDRELFPVESSADAPDLLAGDYRLASLREGDRLHPSQRLFAEDLRRQVFGRDRYTCWNCRQDRRAADPSVASPFFLVVRHLDAAPGQLADLPAERVSDFTRLATRCNRCASADS